MHRSGPATPPPTDALHPASAYQALLAHDARFDGHWFVGVTSTGIYCRPVCRVKPPLERHCRFFRNAALAEAAGFRPCLRCRPEQAPGLAFVDSSQALALHAARRLTRAAREGEDLAMPALAAGLGVTDRHLRRIFLAAHGVSPVDYLTTQRLLQAKQLLTDTDWPITAVAMASGFSSLRRFHAAFAERYRLQPSRWRTGAAGSPATPLARRPQRLATPADEAGSLTLRLAYRPPYDRAGVLHFLSRRAVPGLEQATAEGFQRSLGLEHEGRRCVGWLRVRWPDDAPVMEATLSSGLVPALGKVVQRLREAFDLDAEPALIARALQTVPAPAVPGLRLLGSLDGFEAAVRIVLGQQVSVAAARTLTARLVAALGEPLPASAGGVERLFPTAAALCGAKAETLGQLGIVRQRVGALQALARAVAEGELSLRPGPAPEALRARLLALPGVGPWTAELIALRALGWPDAFPAQDLGVLEALSSTVGGRRAGAAQALAEAWRPWRSYAVMALWRGLDPPSDEPSPEPSPKPSRAPSVARPPTSPVPVPPLPSTVPHRRSDMRLRPLHPPLHHLRIDTPLGPLLLAASDRGLAGVWFDGQRHHPGERLAPALSDDGRHPVLATAAVQLADYFTGRRQGFDLPLDPLGGTAFQRSVWQALGAVPHGRTCGYGELAAACGRPAAVRAVGAAVGRNPLSIVLPCHRVVGAAGALTGYAGGLDRKAALLRLEGAR